jgi:hypothetical protein
MTMKIPIELRIFFIIMVSSLLIFSSSHYGVKAYEVLVKGKGFEENTFISNIDITGLEERDATQLLATKVMDWKNDAEIKLSYQEVSVPFAVDNFSFDIEESLKLVKHSVTNELLVTIEEQSIHEALATVVPNLVAEFEVKKLKQALLYKATKLESGSSVIILEDYLNKPIGKEEIIHSVSFPIVNQDLLKIGSTLSIEPKSTFSLFSFLEKQGLMSLDSSMIDTVSSGVYQTLLYTNFQIIERHISAFLPSHIGLGYEAKIGSELKWDLSFYNPNDNEYKIDIHSNGQSLYFDLIGIPLHYDYTIMQEELQRYEPKVIKQYSPLLNPDEYKVTKEGQSGFYIETSRLVHDKSGKLIEKEFISKDYYAPIHKIIVVGLHSNTNSVNPNPEVNTEEEIPESGNPSDSIDNATDKEVSVDEPNTNADDLVGQIWGREDEIEK